MLVRHSRANDRGGLLSLLPWTHQFGDGCSLRPGVLHSRRCGRRLAALWTVLWFCALLAASGPHLVHHLADHHPHTDKSRPPDCVVFSVMQHTPVAEGILHLLPMSLPVGELSVVGPALMVCEEPWSLFLARAPPA